MAHKNIHICDGCKSLIDEADIFTLAFVDIVGLTTRSSPQRLLYRNKRIDREICASCLEELIDKFQLDKKDDQLVAKAFEGFDLPKRIAVLPDPDPVTCHHDWIMNPADASTDLCHKCGKIQRF